MKERILDLNEIFVTNSVFREKRPERERRRASDSMRERESAKQKAHGEKDNDFDTLAKESIAESLVD